MESESRDEDKSMASWDGREITSILIQDVENKLGVNAHVGNHFLVKKKRAGTSFES